jgi:hypothetical protein
MPCAVACARSPGRLCTAVRANHRNQKAKSILVKRALTAVRAAMSSEGGATSGSPNCPISKENLAGDPVASAAKPPGSIVASAPLEEILITQRESSAPAPELRRCRSRRCFRRERASGCASSVTGHQWRPWAQMSQSPPIAVAIGTAPHDSCRTPPLARCARHGRRCRRSKSPPRRPTGWFFLSWHEMPVRPPYWNS